jgi:hypothetical protein
MSIINTLGVLSQWDFSQTKLDRSIGRADCLRRAPAREARCKFAYTKCLNLRLQAGCKPSGSRYSCHMRRGRPMAGKQMAPQYTCEPCSGEIGHDLDSTDHVNTLRRSLRWSERDAVEHASCQRLYFAREVSRGVEANEADEPTADEGVRRLAVPTIRQARMPGLNRQRQARSFATGWYGRPALRVCS